MQELRSGPFEFGIRVPYTTYLCSYFTPFGVPVQPLPSFHPDPHLPLNLMEDFCQAYPQRISQYTSMQANPSFLPKLVPSCEGTLTGHVITPSSVPETQKNISNKSCHSIQSAASNKGNTMGTEPYLTGNYRHRNVFKSIIRQMHSCVQNNKEEYIATIEKKGFKRTTIEQAFTRIAAFKHAERKVGKRKTGMHMIQHATQQRSVFTYILKAALDFMIKKWSTKNFGRLAERNLATYNTICSEYSKSIEELLKDEN